MSKVAENSIRWRISPFCLENADIACPKCSGCHKYDYNELQIGCCKGGEEKKRKVRLVLRIPSDDRSFSTTRNLGPN